MTVRGVSWAIGRNAAGQPEIDAEIGRALAYEAFGGREGGGAPGDFTVIPRNVPGAGVLVQPGTAGTLSRYPGGAGQAYVSLNDGDEDVPITPTGSGGGRTDMVALVIEDPQYPGQPTPTDPVNGDYTKIRVYEGVSPSTKFFSDVVPNMTGQALALVTLPASTGTVEAEHITNLIGLAAPKEHTETKIVNLKAGDSDVLGLSSYERFPQQAAWQIEIPVWANRVDLELHVTGAQIDNGSGSNNGNWSGQTRVKLGSLVSEETDVGPPVPFDGRTDLFSYMCAATVPIPRALRGTTQMLESQGRKSAATNGVVVAQRAGTCILARARFFQASSTDG